MKLTTKSVLTAGSMVLAMLALPITEANACVHVGQYGSSYYAVVQNNCSYTVVARVYKNNGGEEFVGPISPGGHEAANVQPEDVTNVMYCSRDDWANNSCSP